MHVSHRCACAHIAQLKLPDVLVLEFAIKTRFVLDSWKTSCCPWIFSDVLENSWI